MPLCALSAAWRPLPESEAVRGDLERVVARLAADEALARELGLDASLVRINVLLVLRACARPSADYFSPVHTSVARCSPASSPAASRPSRGT